MELFGSLLSFTSIASIIIGVIRIIALLNKSQIERTLLSDEQKISIHLAQFTITSLFSTLIVLQIVEWTTDDSITNYLNDTNIFIIIILLSAVTGVLVAYAIYFVLVPFLLKKPTYYIEHEEHGNLYIVKSTDKDHILLIDKEGKFNVIELKEKVISYKIFIESRKKTSNKKISKSNQ